MKTPDKIASDIPDVAVIPEFSPGRSELFTVESFMEGFDVKEKSSGKIGSENDHENENEKGMKNMSMKDENVFNKNKVNEVVECSGEKSKEEKLRNALKGGYVATSMTQAVRRTDTLNSTFPEKTINFDIYETSNLKEKVKMEQKLKKEKNEIEERNKMLSKMKIFENDGSDIEKSLNNSNDNNNKIDLNITSTNTSENKKVNDINQDLKSKSVKNLESKFDEIFDAKDKSDNYEDIDDEFLNNDYDDYDDNNKDNDKKVLGKDVRNNDNDDDEFDQIFSSSPNRDLSDKNKNNNNNNSMDKNEKKSNNVTIFDNDNDDNNLENDEFPEICLGEDDSNLKIVNEESV